MLFREQVPGVMSMGLSCVLQMSYFTVGTVTGNFKNIQIRNRKDFQSLKLCHHLMIFEGSY